MKSSSFLILLQEGQVAFQGAQLVIEGLVPCLGHAFEIAVLLNCRAVFIIDAETSAVSHPWLPKRGDSDSKQVVVPDLIELLADVDPHRITCTG